MKRRYITYRAVSLLLSCVCAASALVGCGASTAEGETVSEVIPVEVQMPASGTLTIQNEFIGRVSPEEAVYVLPLVTAEALSVSVSVGDQVSAGQELCKLDTEAAELQMASAQAQYNSAQAGVQAAQVGYEIAKAQYDNAAAQIDLQNEQTKRQKDLTMYQMQAQIDTIDNGIGDINRQIAGLQEDKADALGKRDDLTDAKKQAADYVKLAQSSYDAASTAFGYGLAQRNYQALIAQVSGMESGQIPHTDDQLTAAKAGLEEARTALDTAKAKMKPHEEALNAAKAAASQVDSAYAQVEAGIDSIEDGEEKLRDTLADTQQSREQAVNAKSLTEAQLSIDTKPMQDGSKRTAALGVDSAAAQVNSAKVGAAGAKVGIDSAQYQLDMYTLTAPIDGVIEAVNLKEHDFASPGTPAFVISNKDTMTVTFGVSEGIRETLRVGQKLGIDRNGAGYSAAITEIGSMLDQNTGLFLVKACVSKPDERLLTGSSVKVKADTYSQKDAVLIPYDAVYYDDSQAYVYVAEGGKARRRDVETGIFDSETITVLSGLSTEESLITSWTASLRDGAKIEVKAAEGK